MSAIRTDAYTFEPALFSHGELRFLLDHLKEPPHAAMHGGLPIGVNATQIEKTLTEFQRLEQLAQYRNVPWAGFDAIADSILRFLSWEEKRSEIFRVTGGPSAQNAIPQASQYEFSENGEAFKFAIGADNAEMARTEILDDGSRRAFAVRLLQADGEASVDMLAKVAPWIKRTSGNRAANKDTITIDKSGKHGTITCSVCKKSESFETARRSAFLTARSRMARHLKSAKTDVSRHRLLYRKEFESPTAKV